MFMMSLSQKRPQTTDWSRREGRVDPKMKWLTLALTFTLAGCNTLSGRWEQKLLVRTTNSQDQIIEGESTLLPQGPQVTSVRRRRRGQIKIQKQDGSVEAYPLSGHYAAWWENLFFLHLTPAAWVTDWLTGAGYEYEG